MRSRSPARPRRPGTRTSREPARQRRATGAALHGLYPGRFHGGCPRLPEPQRVQRIGEAGVLDNVIGFANNRLQHRVPFCV